MEKRLVEYLDSFNNKKTNKKGTLLIDGNRKDRALGSKNTLTNQVANS